MQAAEAERWENFCAQTTEEIVHNNNIIDSLFIVVLVYSYPVRG